MRVVSGKARGLKLNTIESDSTRPTKDMVKEALFSMIRDKIQDAIFLDLFAGSGGIGVEALSEGAKCCYFSDINKECIKVINDNIKRAHFEDCAFIYNLDYLKMLEKVKNIKFDLIYIDPPYNMGLGQKAIEEISKLDLLNDGGVLVYETDEDEQIPDTIGKYTLYKEKKYGRNRLKLYS